MPDSSTLDPAVPTPATRAPMRKPFRTKFLANRPTPESLERQSRVTLLAWNQLGADQAVAFLNSHHDALGGRPLDLAVASVAGCEAVEQAIAARADGR